MTASSHVFSEDPFRKTDLSEQGLIDGRLENRRPVLSTPTSVKEKTSDRPWGKGRLVLARGQWKGNEPANRTTKKNPSTTTTMEDSEECIWGGTISGGLNKRVGES